jgi:hypothetical protein
MRRRKWIKASLIVGFIAGAAWIIIESAKAISMF